MSLPPPPGNFEKFKFVLAKMCAFIAQKALKVTSESINSVAHTPIQFILLDNQLV